MQLEAPTSGEGIVVPEERVVVEFEAKEVHPAEVVRRALRLRRGCFRVDCDRFLGGDVGRGGGEADQRQRRQPSPHYDLPMVKTTRKRALLLIMRA